MNFLEAKRVVAAFTGGAELPFLFALSGTAEPFALYLRAAAALRGRAARPRFLPFNTLRQALLGPPAPDEDELFLLLPWDLLGQGDWRAGLPPERVSIGQARESAEPVLLSVTGRPRARICYLPAPLPPLTGDVAGDAALDRLLTGLAAAAGATVLPAEDFSLPGYFGSGCPVGGAALGRTAAAAVDLLLPAPEGAAKVLVTDLDNVLWSGVVAEDGLDGIAGGPEGRGYRHFVYQTLLARLRREGVLLAAVSRNSPEVALGPLRSGLTLRESDFVAILAGYGAKSAQIRELAERLNLGFDAFVFVDDNPVELSEVAQALPQVQTIAFPDRDDGLPALLTSLGARFARRTLTAEDRERTELYRRRLAGLAPVRASGADLTEFLAGLDMRLTIHDRSAGDRARAVQLINKTNQFNLNGRRWTDAEVGALLAAGGRLLTASLADRSGSHGEILAFLLSAEGIVEAFVMSCRVFQRRVEQAFLADQLADGLEASAWRHAPTDRNEPFRDFIAQPAFTAGGDGLLHFESATFLDANAGALTLFRVERS